MVVGPGKTVRIVELHKARLKNCARNSRYSEFFARNKLEMIRSNCPRFSVRVFVEYPNGDPPKKKNGDGRFVVSDIVKTLLVSPS